MKERVQNTSKRAGATSRKVMPGEEQPAPRKQSKYSAYQKQYRQSKLGYGTERNATATKVDTAKRVAIIFDHTVHRKTVKQIIRDHAINYSTLRHVLIQYYLFGRTDIRKFRLSKSELEAFERARAKQSQESVAKIAQTAFTDKRETATDCSNFKKDNSVIDGRMFACHDEQLAISKQCTDVEDVNEGQSTASHPTASHDTDVVCKHSPEAEPFDRYMYSLEAEAKNYMNNGPHKIDK